MPVVNTAQSSYFTFNFRNTSVGTLNLPDFFLHGNFHLAQFQIWQASAGEKFLTNVVGSPRMQRLATHK